jgi:hypothetical protein
VHRAGGGKIRVRGLETMGGKISLGNFFALIVARRLSELSALDSRRSRSRLLSIREREIEIETVCVCLREGDRVRESERECESERERERERER